MPKVSVIIPVYNIVPYLEKCLDSVINQSMQEIEIIVVNDGSTDGSDIIISRYADSDKRIKVIHKTTNEGTVLARLSGLKTATSDYILLLDGDDFLEPDALQLLYTEAMQSNADIVAADFWYYNSITKEKYSSSIESDFPINTSIEYLNAAFLGKAYWAVWCYLFKRSFYEKSKIVHYKEISFGEDLLTTAQLCLQDAKFSKIDTFTVNYVQRDTSVSASKSYSEKQYNDMLAYCNIASDLIKASPYCERLHIGLEAVKFRGQAAAFTCNYFKNGTERSRQILKTLKKYPEFKQYVARRQMKIIKAFSIHNLIGNVLVWQYKKRKKI